MIRIGHAHDTHRLVEGRSLILGGVLIEHPKGLLGHSDADVVYHVVAEAIIGALGMGDLGTHFPDTDPKYFNKDSSYFVIEAVQMMKQAGYHVNNIDLTIFCEKPILKNVKPLMRVHVSELLETSLEQVNIKATRGEGLGFIGREEGISAEAVVLIETI